MSEHFFVSVLLQKKMENHDQQQEMENTNISKSTSSAEGEFSTL